MNLSRDDISSNFKKINLQIAAATIYLGTVLMIFLSNKPSIMINNNLLFYSVYKTAQIANVE